MDRRRGVLLALVLLLLVPARGGVAAAGGPSAAEGCVEDASGRAPDDLPPGLAALMAMSPAGPVTAVATHQRAPDDDLTLAIERLGLVAQPLQHLPMTLLHGPVDRLLAAARLPGVRDIHPDRALQRHSRTSARAIGADVVWEDLGYTGEGVGIAIVDSGIDATHPAFEGRVRRNVKLVGPAYLAHLGLPVARDMPPGTLVLAADAGPYSNTDAQGHGTHVAGIAGAGDVGGDEGDSPVGMAPGAHLLGYAVGELHVITALAAFDDILERREEDAIGVVNASWGDGFAVFDPDAPLNVATRALHDAGIVVVFSAGNGGEEMTLNGLSAAPWVISVASASLGGAPSATSSGGLRFDNALPDPAAGHRRFEGDRLGLHHPDVAAPGERILSTTTPTGATAPPGAHPPGGTGASSGTSMAAPHVAGLAALLLEARPSLSPEQVKGILQVTARPAPGWSVWKAGFGLVDAHRAVTLATEVDPAALPEQHRAVTQRLLDRRDRAVVGSDHWMLTASGPVTAAGVEHHCLPFEVTGGAVTSVRVGVAFAATAPGIRNEFRWVADVHDAAGRLLGSTSPSLRNGVAALEIDLAELGDLALGTWRLELRAEAAVTDVRPQWTPEVHVVVTQLEAQVPEVPPAGGELALRLAPVGAPGPVTGPEGCSLEPPPAAGRLGPDGGAGCRVAPIGYAASRAGPATFTSAQLSQSVAVGGTGELTLHLVDEAQPAWGTAVGSRVFFTLEAVDPSGAAEPLLLAAGEPATQVGPAALRGVYPFDVPEVAVPAGRVLRLVVEVSGAPTLAARLLYGGAYDSSLVLPLAAG